MAEIYICKHCHCYLKGKANHCSDCDTAEKRKAMDEANRSVMPNFKCHECDLKQKYYLTTKVEDTISQ